MAEVAPTWGEVVAAIGVGDAIPYWSSYQRSNGTFTIRQVEENRILVTIAGKAQPVVISQKHLELLAVHYSAVSKLLKNTEG